ncbi:hypothetical protein RDABS01_010533 [Bienertia sinuspersici]
MHELADIFQQRVEKAVDKMVVAYKRQAQLTELKLLCIREENRKGSSNFPTIPFLVWFVRKLQVNVLFLMEMHLNGEGVSSLCLALGFDCFDFSFVSTSSRGLAVLWSNQVTLQLAQWNLLLLYASPYIANRLQVWDSVSHQLASSALPCLIQGDFNQMESSDQKWGGIDYISGVQVFRDGDNRLYQRLDRATATQDWIQMYPDSTVVNFPITLFDHSPIMLNTQPPHQKRRTRIQMNSWSLNFDEVRKFIQQHWNYSVTGSPIFSCTSKIKRVRYNMFKWCQSYAKKHHTLWEDLNASYTSAQLGVGTPLSNYTEQTTCCQAI